MTKPGFLTAFKKREDTLISEVSNLFHCDANNIGDQMCGPGQYLWPDACRNLPLVPVRKRLGNTNVGGGQIFSQLSTILASIHRINPAARVIGWGIGLPPAGVRDEIVREVTKSFALFGTRNYTRREHLSFVPCASCLSPLFDQVAQPKHEVVFYLHRRKGAPIVPPADVPVMTNAMRPFQDVVDFIAAGEVLVTSSYHGVYWAQLLGRRVICLPYNNKFETFQHRPTMAEVDNWREKMTLASQTVPLLEEYRALNYAFAKRALEVWNE